MEDMSIIVVDDEADFRRTCAMSLADSGCRALEAPSAAEALSMLEREHVDVALVDVLMPEMNGLQLLRELKECHPELEVIIMSASASVPWAVEAVKSGAADYLLKPFSREDLLRALEVARRAAGLSSENRRLRQALELPQGPARLLGNSSAMRELRRNIRKVAATDVNVLIIGESGTGKELVARALHEAGTRREGPFVAVNCGALPRELVESELFGHERGAFTGAQSLKEGLFEAANGGTIFLDEISSMHPETQVHLLRVLETGEVRRLGSTQTKLVNVRVLAAATSDLQSEESFRRDLFYRLSVVTIRLQPLRGRKEDIPALVEYFLAGHGRAGSVCGRFSPEAMAVLEAHDWPGNVRELENVIERCCTLATGPVIRKRDLPASVTSSSPEAVAAGQGSRHGADEPSGPAVRLGTLDEVKREAILRTLEAVGHDRARAAEILGIDRSTLYRAIKHYGLSSPGRKKAGR